MAPLPIPDILFVIASVALITSAVLVVTIRNPVRSVLSLVLCFLFTTILWLLLQAEFLSLVLIFVYIGAVMTLFMFVVMMMHVDKRMLSEKFVSYLPLGVGLLVVFVGLIVYALHHHNFTKAAYVMPHFPANYHNTESLGAVLYTHYVLAFEMASVILLVALLAAISLVFQGRQSGKSQCVDKQIQAKKKDRLVVIDMKSEAP